MTNPTHPDWGVFDSTSASVEGWDIFPGYKERPLRLERRYLIGAFGSDELAWRHVWVKAEAGSALHARAMALLKKHSPTEHAEIRRHCLGLDTKHNRFQPKEET